MTTRRVESLLEIADRLPQIRREVGRGIFTPAQEEIVGFLLESVNVLGRTLHTIIDARGPGARVSWQGDEDPWGEGGD